MSNETSSVARPNLEWFNQIKWYWVILVYKWYYTLVYGNNLSK